MNKRLVFSHYNPKCDLEIDCRNCDDECKARQILDCKTMAMDLSYKMGFDGDITPEVLSLSQRNLDNEDYHKESQKAHINDNIQYVIEQMRIANEIRRIKRRTQNDTNTINNN